MTAYLAVPSQGDRTEQVRIRLKNLLQRGAKELAAQWMPEEETGKFLRPLAERAEELAGIASPGTLAIFLAEGFFRAVPLRTPGNDWFGIGREFSLLPLVRMTQDRTEAFVLALSENRVQLYAVDEFALQEIEVPGLPANFEQELNVVSADRGQQVRSVGTFSGGTAIYHGQGGIPDAHKKELRQYLHAIEEKLAAYFHAKRASAPLLLACVEATEGVYRQLNSYPQLCEEVIAGNPDYQAPKALHAAAVQQLAAHSLKARGKVVRRVQEGLITGKSTIDAKTVVRAAHQGRLDSLLVAPTARAFGTYDASADRVQMTENPAEQSLAPYGDDLLERTILETLRHDGTVIEVATGALPEGSLLAGILRY